MQQINAEHDALFETLKKKHNASADEYHQTTETPEEFREIIMKLIIIPGLDIELCGSWLWIGGNTFGIGITLKKGANGVAAHIL